MLKQQKIYSVKLGKSARELQLECIGLKKVVNGNLFVNNELILAHKKPLELVISNEDVFTSNIINNSSKVTENGFIVKEFNINNTTKFILPMLFDNKETLLYDHNLINGYVKSSKYYGECVGDLIHICFRYFPFEYYQTIIDVLSKLKTHTIEFIDKDKSKDGRFDILSFKIKSELLKLEINKIMSGKYNKITEYSKNKILKFHGLDMKSNMAGILFNTKDYMVKECARFDMKISDIANDFNFKKRPTTEDEIWI